MSNNPVGSQKLFSFLVDLHRREDFYSDLKSIREEFRIPPEGLETPSDGLDIRMSVLPPNITEKEVEVFNTRLKELASKYRMGPLSNKLKILTVLVVFDIAYIPDGLGTVMLEDLPSMTLKRRELMGLDDKLYPVSIRLSPYTTLSELKNFLDKNFSQQILPLLNRYKDRKSDIGKVRIRKRMDISDFLYENSKKLGSGTKLYRAMTEKFTAEKSPDMGGMTKLLSEERKRRGEKK